MAAWEGGAVTTAPPAGRPAGGPDDVAPAVLTELQARRLGPVRRFFVRHRTVMDVLIIAVFGVAALVSAIATPATLSQSGDYVDDPTPLYRLAVIGLLGAVLGCVALVWRRRRPVVVAGVMAGLGAASLALVGHIGVFDLGLALALYAVAAARPPRVMWATFGVVVLVVAGAIWTWEQQEVVDAATSLGLEVDPEPADADADPSAAPGPGPGPAPLGSAQTRALSISGLLVGNLVAVSIGSSVRNRRLHVAELIERTNALARDRDQQARLARAAERSRIAREMHDVVAHSITVMIALSDGATAALTRSPELSRTALDELSSTGRSALADMRRVLGVLDDDGAPLAPQPGSLDLAALVERFRTAGLPVRTRGLSTALPQEATLQLAVYRIVSEALTNALRHAPGTAQVELCLSRTASAVEIEVLDEGATVPAQDAGGSGRGLIGMSERAAVYGGTVEAGPRPGGGWRVHATLPWSTTEGDA